MNEIYATQRRHTCSDRCPDGECHPLSEGLPQKSQDFLPFFVVLENESMNEYGRRRQQKRKRSANGQAEIKARDL